MGIIENSLHQAETALHEFISDPQTPVLMEKAVAIFKQALDKGCKIISCGNGGSLCDAAHFAEELTGRFRGDRRPLPAMAINDAAYMTCVGNDFSFDQILRVGSRRSDAKATCCRQSVPAAIRAMW